MKASSPDQTPLGLRLLTAGTAACIADFATFPLDTAKVRLQLQGEGRAVVAVSNGSAMLLRSGGAPAHYQGLVGTVLTIARQEGFRSLYNGLSAGLQRQMCFASVRLGLYDSVKTFYQQILDGNVGGASGGRVQVGVGARVAAGLSTGALAVLLAQPTDVVKVRLQAARGARYPSSLSAYRTIAAEEGARGLWRGTFPNVSRNAIVNVSEIVCYDIIKDTFLYYDLMSDNVPCHFVSAVIAGFCTTVAASPVDVVKTRYMNSAEGEYKGAVDCAIRMLTQEGPASFYKGFTPSFCRLVSWNIVMWITYEHLKKMVSEASTRRNIN